jgi:O-glycosyl hydrolase
MKSSILMRRLIVAPAVALLLAPLAVAQYTGTADFTSKKQNIDGFGVAATFGRPIFIQQAVSPVPSQIVDQLFNPLTGAGITMLRLGVDDVLASGASSSGAAPNSGTLIVNTAPISCNVTPTYTWDHSNGGEVWLSQQALKYGVKRFFADSWGAPGYMKTNNSLVSGGVVCDGTSSTNTATQCKKTGFSDCRAAYANYMVQFVKFFQHDGVPVTDLGWINEPNTNTATYASMTPTAAQAITFTNVYGPIVRASGINVNQTCCDVFNWSTANTYDTTVINNATANSYVDIYTAHEYGQVANFVQNTGTPTKKNWMSEWGPASPAAYNPTWDKTFAGTSNNTNNGMFVANDISNALNKGSISAYIWWYADSTGATGGMIQMSAAQNATSFVVTKRLFALGHFARFVHPGAYQVAMSTNHTNLNATAFINPDGSKVINVVNNDTVADALTLGLDATTANWVPTSYFSDENDNIAPTNVATVSGTTLSANFAPRSLTTIVLAPPVVSGTVQLILTPTLQAQGDGSYIATLKISNAGSGTAQNVQLTSATLGTAVGSTLPVAALPYSVGNIAPGSFELVTVNFPAGQTAGTAVVEKYTGTYTGGSMGGSTRAVLPALP